VRHPDPQRWIGTSAAQAPLMQAIVEHDREGIVETAGLDGQQRVYAFTPFANGTLSVGLPTATAYAESNRRILENALAAIVVMLLALIAAWVGADVVLLRRLRTLITATEELEAGDLGPGRASPTRRASLAGWRGRSTRWPRRWSAGIASARSSTGRAWRARPVIAPSSRTRPSGSAGTART
jgi:hypothetical protein